MFFGRAKDSTSGGETGLFRRKVQVSSRSASDANGEVRAKSCKGKTDAGSEGAEEEANGSDGEDLSADDRVNAVAKIEVMVVAEMAMVTAEASRGRGSGGDMIGRRAMLLYLVRFCIGLLWTCSKRTRGSRCFALSRPSVEWALWVVLVHKER